MCLHCRLYTVYIFSADLLLQIAKAEITILHLETHSEIACQRCLLDSLLDFSNQRKRLRYILVLEIKITSERVNQREPSQADPFSDCTAVAVLTTQ